MSRRIGRRQVTQRTTAYIPDTPRYTLAEATEYVLRVKRANNLKERTLRGYIANMRYFLDWINQRYPNLYANDVTVDILREYVLWCANEKQYYDGHPFKSEYDKNRRGLSPASVNVRIRVLRTFFATMYDEGIIDRNPAKNLTLMREDTDTVEPLTDDEIRRLLAAIDRKYYAQNRDYVIILLILDTGIRLNEICALERSEIDFQKKLITLPASKNKNRRSRTLPISSDVVRLLRQLVEETAGYFDTPYVFVTNYGEPLNEKTIQKALTKYAEKAKIPKRVTPHVLRHNFATMAANNGMSIFHLQKILGHADITTTRRYVQISENDLLQHHSEFSPITRVLKRKQRGGSLK
jgi:integrase/recombinase XerD